MNQIRTFEKMLIEEKRIDLREVAKSNARYQSDHLHRVHDEFIQDNFVMRANLNYPGFEMALSTFRTVFTSVFLPGGCNADCPICFTLVNKRKPTPFDVLPSEWLNLLEKFAQLDNLAVRYIGIGEPVIDPHLAEYLRQAREVGMYSIIFTNGLMIPRDVKDEFERGNVLIYVKGWAEDEKIQTEMVLPKGGLKYNYIDGKFGPAPHVFYELLEINEKRVGFEVCFDQRYFEHALKVIQGPKKELPLLIEPAVDIRNIPESVPKDMPADTIGCTRPPRGMIYTYYSEVSELLHGTFCRDNTIPVRVETIEKIRPISPLLNRMHFEASYPKEDGCHCLWAQIQQQTSQASSC